MRCFFCLLLRVIVLSAEPWWFIIIMYVISIEQLGILPFFIQFRFFSIESPYKTPKIVCFTVYYHRGVANENEGRAKLWNCVFV